MRLSEGPASAFADTRATQRGARPERGGWGPGDTAKREALSARAWGWGLALIPQGPSVARPEASEAWGWGPTLLSKVGTDFTYWRGAPPPRLGPAAAKQPRGVTS